MIRLVAFLATALILTGCSNSPEEDFIGTWHDAEEGYNIEFFTDGTMVVQEADGEDQLSGDYEILNDERIVLRLSDGRSEARTLVASYEFRGDTLTLNAPDGFRSNMTRTTR